MTYPATSIPDWMHPLDIPHYQSLYAKGWRIIDRTSRSTDIRLWIQQRGGSLDPAQWVKASGYRDNERTGFMNHRGSVYCVLRPPCAQPPRIPRLQQAHENWLKMCQAEETLKRSLSDLGVQNPDVPNKL